MIRTRTTLNIIVSLLIAAAGVVGCRAENETPPQTGGIQIHIIYPETGQPARHKMSLDWAENEECAELVRNYGGVAVDIIEHNLRNVLGKYPSGPDITQLWFEEDGRVTEEGKLQIAATVANLGAGNSPLYPFTRESAESKETLGKIAKGVYDNICNTPSQP